MINSRRAISVVKYPLANEFSYTYRDNRCTTVCRHVSCFQPRSTISNVLVFQLRNDVKDQLPVSCRISCRDDGEDELYILFVL